MTILILSTSNRAEQFYAAARAQNPAAKIRVWPDTGPVEDITFTFRLHGAEFVEAGGRAPATRGK